MTGGLRIKVYNTDVKLKRSDLELTDVFLNLKQLQ